MVAGALSYLNTLRFAAGCLLQSERANKFAPASFVSFPFKGKVGMGMVLLWRLK